MVKSGPAAGQTKSGKPDGEDCQRAQFRDRIGENRLAEIDIVEREIVAAGGGIGIADFNQRARAGT